jgi:hypothetical protein
VPHLEGLAIGITHGTSTLADAGKSTLTAEGEAKPITHQHVLTVLDHFNIPVSPAGPGRPQVHAYTDLTALVRDEREKHPTYGYKAMRKHLKHGRFADALRGIPAGENDLRRAYNDLARTEKPEPPPTD